MKKTKLNKTYNLREDDRSCVSINELHMYPSRYNGGCLFLEEFFVVGIGFNYAVVSWLDYILIMFGSRVINV